MEVKVIGQMDNTIDHTFESANRVYDKNGLAPTINTCGGGGLQPKVIVAMRGRYTDESETQTEQRLEPNAEGLCNTLTSVQKDNLVIERATVCIGGLQEHQTPRTDGISQTLTSAMGMGGGQIPIINEPVLVGGLGEKKSNNGTQYYQQDRVYSMDGVAMCHPSQIPGGSYNYLDPTFRIRKLTEKECWRLMDFSDDDFDKASKVNSATQLYTQAGNSIVKNVLVAIIGQMLEGKEDEYKKQT